MCGRYSVGTDYFRLAARFDLNPDGYVGWQSRWNVAPGQDIPVVLPTKDGNGLASMRWGLAPSWAKANFRPINLRSETVLEKRGFREIALNRRCILPADGYYEWDREKQPWRFVLPGGELFGMAGVWTEGTCAILTRNAESCGAAALHDRMPVILPQAAEREWLEGRSENLVGLLDALRAARVGLRWYRVSKRVNSSANEGAKCVEPTG